MFHVNHCCQTYFYFLVPQKTKVENVLIYPVVYFENIFFIFCQIRLVVEEGLNQLPYNKCVVTTPTGEN